MRRSSRLKLSSGSSTEGATQNTSISANEKANKTRRGRSVTPKSAPKNARKARRKSTNSDTQLSEAESSIEVINSPTFDEPDVEIVRQSDTNSIFPFDPTVGYDEMSKKKRPSAETDVNSLPGCSKSSPESLETEKSYEIDDCEMNLPCETSDEEWEEVANEEEVEKEVVIPKNGVEFTLAAEDVMKKRKKKAFDWNNYARLCVNRFKKEVQQDLHKVHVMCLLGHGFFVNERVNGDLMSGLVLSIIADKFLKLKPKKVDLTQLTELVRWFHAEFRFDLAADEPRKSDFESSIIEAVGERTVRRCVDAVAIFVCVLRVLGFDARLVYSMQPISVKPSDLIKPKTSSELEKKMAAKRKPKKVDENHRKTTKKVEIEDEDDDFEPKVRKKRTRQPSEASEETKMANPVRKKAKMENCKTGNDYWAEIYFEKKSEWICVDCINCRIDGEMESRATQPLIYVVSYDNKSKVKDLTQRYAANWLSSNRKLRFDPDWWTELLKPLKPRLTVREKKENAAIKDALYEKPLPKTIGEFKGHPLYVLTRHLLKFEAIYPPDSFPVGYIRSEPIYSRDCVHTLHSRETWLKDAKTVKVGEKAYKS